MTKRLVCDLCMSVFDAANRAPDWWELTVNDHGSKDALRYYDVCTACVPRPLGKNSLTDALRRLLNKKGPSSEPSMKVKE